MSGKHYPGEQLPRWALYAHWRATANRSGAIPPCWPPPRLPIRATAADAARFCAALAERLQVDPSLIHPAYEDVHYYLWREHRLPANVLAEDAKLADPMERARLARVFGHGLGAPVGCVLPLRRAIRDDARVWQSGKWFFRGDALFLLPGRFADRLPPAAGQPALGRSRRDRTRDRARSVRAARAAAAASGVPSPCRPADSMGAGAEGFRPVPQELPVVGRGEPELVRTALCVEPRDGVIHVFFPPLYAAEDWLALAAAVEDTAGGARPQGGAGRLPAAARSAACCISRSPPIPA